MTTLWRYTALTDNRGVRKGELAGGSAADVRAALRRIGLQVVRIRPIRPRMRRGDGTIGATILARWHRHLCARRGPIRAELYDSLATMLEAGVPLVESIETLMESAQAPGAGRFSARRSMLTQLRESLRSGASLAEAISQPEARGWFDAVEVAMIRAGQHSGTLSQVLRNLASRQERSGELQSRLIGAMAYPAVIACVGLGVVVFLSVKTLPELTSMLTQADVPVPALTKAVMAFGQVIASHWLLILALCAGLAASIALIPSIAHRLGVNMPSWRPQVLRRVAVARLAAQLSELAQSGVPLVEAMRISAESCPAALRQVVRGSADRMERGEELSAALDDAGGGGGWFDAEFSRLVQVGVWSGELPAILQRLADRFERRAARLIDRLATLLEPFVILSLATLIGIVAMAAILPLVRLQEVLR